MEYIKKGFKQNSVNNVIGFSELKKRFLPHRYPIILIDRVTDYSPGKYIQAIKCVTGNSPELVGHFPERAIMPGTAIVQAFAQLAIIFFKITNGELENNEMTLISSVNFRFLAPVVPGDMLSLDMKPKEFNEKVGILIGKAEVNSKKVAAGQIYIFKTMVDRFSGVAW